MIECITCFKVARALDPNWPVQCNLSHMRTIPQS